MTVKCPTCGQHTSFSPENLHRPFCSERCQTLDLGAWADERYRVPVEADKDPQSSLSRGSSLEIPSKDLLN